MRRQKITFFLIVGSAILLVCIASVCRLALTIFEPWLRHFSTEELQVEFIDINKDAWPRIYSYDKSNDPPEAGKRMLLMTVKITYVTEAEGKPIGIAASDFKVIGEGGIYNTNSCGWVPNELYGVVNPNDSIEGAICAQVPENEKKLVLVYGVEDAWIEIPLPE